MRVIPEPKPTIRMRHFMEQGIHQLSLVSGQKKVEIQGDLHHTPRTIRKRDGLIVPQAALHLSREAKRNLGRKTIGKAKTVGRSIERA